MKFFSTYSLLIVLSFIGVQSVYAVIIGDDIKESYEEGDVRVMAYDTRLPEYRAYRIHRQWKWLGGGVTIEHLTDAETLFNTFKARHEAREARKKIFMQMLNACKCCSRKKS